jgi:hypothetical protein
MVAGQYTNGPKPLSFVDGHQLIASDPWQLGHEGAMPRLAGPFSHDNEVAWSLWAALRLKLILRRTAVDALAKLDDPIVVLQALDAEESGLCEVPLDKTRWEALMTSDSLSDEHWLLAYEGHSHSWLGQGGTDLSLEIQISSSYVRQVCVSTRLIASKARPAALRQALGWRQCSTERDSECAVVRRLPLSSTRKRVSIEPSALVISACCTGCQT